LDDYISVTMDILVHGDEEIPVGSAVDAHKLPENPRMDVLRSTYSNRKV